MNNRLKQILISIGAVIVVAGLAFGALILLNRPSNTDQGAPVATVEPGQVDTSKDYGACTVLDKAVIQNTLGSVAQLLQGPDNTGRVYIGSQFGEQIKGDETQSCVYSFIEGGTFENGFNGQQGLTVEVYVHGSQESLDAFAIANEPGVIAGSIEGKPSYFLSNDVVEPAGTRHSLTLIDGLRHYTLSITEPRDATTFTTETAQQALQTLAQNLSV